MAVPSSGVLDWYSLAQECYLGTYGSGTITGCMAIKELVIGGQPCSGAFTYAAVSGNSPPPDSSTPYAANEFYGYDKDYVSLTSFGCSNNSPFNKFGSACNLTGSNTYYHDGSGTYPVVNDTCYTSSAGTTTIPNYSGQALAYWKILTGSANMKTVNGVVTEKNTCI